MSKLRHHYIASNLIVKESQDINKGLMHLRKSIMVLAGRHLGH